MTGSADDATSAADPDPPPPLTVAALARRLGVAPATLRTWDRRYGLGPTGHSAGSHRRYTHEDCQRLEQMRRLTLEGVSPAEAAKAALASPIPKALSGREASDTTARPADQAPSTARASAAVRGLTRAALALDARTIDKAVSESLARQGVLWTWDAVLVPVLSRVGSRWETTGNGVDVEHLLAESIQSALRSVTLSGPAPRNSRPVLLACAPDELHTLPLQALCAALAERAIDARVLGARVPADALAAAVRRGGACAVFIWAHCAEMADSEQVAAVPAMRPAVQVLVGGPGWNQLPPQGASHVGSMSEAVTVLQRAAGC